MSGSEESPSVESVPEPREADVRAESSVLDLVAELRGELSSLKDEVLDLRNKLQSSSPTPKGADPAEAVTILDEEAFTAELEMAMAHPDPSVENLESPEEEVTIDQVELLHQSEQALKLHPELSEVIEAIEAELPLSAQEKEEEGLSSEEIDALFTATSHIGEGGDTGADSGSATSAVPDVADPPVTPAIDSTAPAAGTMMSEEEIMNLLIEAKGDPRVIPVDPNDEAATAELDAELVSADEIKAMLGVKDEEDESVPKPVILTELVEPAPTVDPPLEIEDSTNELEPTADDSGLDMETVDPSAVARVPASLAATALALPVCVVDDRLHCLCIEPFDQEALDQISKAVGLTVVPHAGAPERVLNELRARYGAADEAAVRSADPVAGPSAVARLLGKVLRRPA